MPSNRPIAQQSWIGVPIRTEKGKKNTERLLVKLISGCPTSPHHLRPRFPNQVLGDFRPARAAKNTKATKPQANDLGK